MICPNAECPYRTDNKSGKVVTHGFYNTLAGKRRRYCCFICGKTFCSTKNTPYYRFQHRRSKFDEVAALSVEGVNKSVISRVKGIAWNTVHHWLEKAAESCGEFNRAKSKVMDIRELQADEIRTLTGSRKTPVWIFAAMDIWSRFWPATVVGTRSCENTETLFRAVSKQTNPQNVPLIVTDGFEFHQSASRRCSAKCLYAQVIKTRRKDRIVKVEKRMIIGSKNRIEKALKESEDSKTINTCFKERLNLTIRQSTAYLTRRTTCFARFPEYLENQLENLRCHYNYLRPHRALKLGNEKRTPAMQAGLSNQRYSFREVFTLCFILKILWEIKRKMKSELQSLPNAA